MGGGAGEELALFRDPAKVAAGTHFGCMSLPGSIQLAKIDSGGQGKDR
jgi:hypothetical protein